MGYLEGPLSLNLSDREPKTTNRDARHAGNGSDNRCPAGAAERLGRPEVDDELEFDRAHHRQIGRHKCRPGKTARLARGGATGEVHRWQVLARLRNLSHLPKSVWSLGYCRLAFVTLSSSHFDPELTSCAIKVAFQVFTTTFLLAFSLRAVRQRQLRSRTH